MESANRPYLAFVLRLGAALTFTLMFMMVKLASESGVKLQEILFWRQAMTAPVLYVWLASHGALHRLRTRRLGAHALRAGVGLTNLAIIFTATALLPLAETTTLGFAAPLFAVVIAAMVLNEQIGPWRWSAVLLGFAGVLVIAQPGGGGHVDALGTTLALVGALLMAVINFQIRDLGRSEEAICIVFWFGLFGAIVTALALPFYITPHNSHQWLLLGGVGLTGLIGQLMMTGSLRFGSVASVIVMDYSSLVWATLLGWLVWNHLPPAATFIGAPLIVAAGIVIFWREHLLARSIAISPLVAD